MEGEIITRSAALARDDREFQLDAACWTGSLTLVVGDAAWRIAMRSGRMDDPTSVDAVAVAPSDIDVVIVAAPEVWEQLSAPVSVPGFTDFFAAMLKGLLTMTPQPADAGRHNALRRFTELLRHARAGTNPLPEPRVTRLRHGEHDTAVGRYVHLDLDGVDHRVYYEESGSGIPLLCQHTAGADGRQWRHFLEDARVTKRFRVIAYDLPYHGKSLPPESRAWWADEYRLTTKAAMAVPLALADALTLNRPVFIGSSIGGCLALDLARFHADRFRAVIALGAALKIDDSVGKLSEAERAAAAAEQRLRDPAQHAALMMMVMAPTAPEAFRQETRFVYAQGAPGVFPGDIYYYSTDHDLRSEAGSIDTGRCPVYLFTGEYDFFTVGPTLEAAREIKGSQCEIMTGLGHFPMSEDYDRLSVHILPVLDEIAARI